MFLIFFMLMLSVVNCGNASDGSKKTRQNQQPDSHLNNNNLGDIEAVKIIETDLMKAVKNRPNNDEEILKIWNGLSQEAKTAELLLLDSAKLSERKPFLYHLIANCSLRVITEILNAANDEIYNTEMTCFASSNYNLPSRTDIKSGIKYGGLTLIAMNNNRELDIINSVCNKEKELIIYSGDKVSFNWFIQALRTKKMNLIREMQLILLGETTEDRKNDVYLFFFHENDFKVENFELYIKEIIDALLISSKTEGYDLKKQLLDYIRVNYIEGFIKSERVATNLYDFIIFSLISGLDFSKYHDIAIDFKKLMDVKYIDNFEIFLEMIVKKNELFIDNDLRKYICLHMIPSKYLKDEKYLYKIGETVKSIFLELDSENYSEEVNRLNNPIKGLTGFGLKYKKEGFVDKFELNGYTFEIAAEEY